MRLIDADELIKSIEYEVNRLNSAMYYALQHDMFATRANLKIQKNTLEGLIDEIEKLPSAERDYKFDEWCTDCKEYDHERHCCPRFNQVIRTTLQEVQEERKKGKWILKPNIYGVAYCSECDYELHTNNTNYCPNCGAYMIGEDE